MADLRLFVEMKKNGNNIMGLSDSPSVALADSAPHGTGMTHAGNDTFADYLIRYRQFSINRSALFHSTFAIVAAIR